MDVVMWWSITLFGSKQHGFTGGVSDGRCYVVEYYTPIQAVNSATSQEV